jgi:hypothetical protein
MDWILSKTTLLAVHEVLFKHKSVRICLQYGYKFLVYNNYMDNIQQTRGLVRALELVAV